MVVVAAQRERSRWRAGTGSRRTNCSPWRWLYASGAVSAVGAGEEVVAAAEYRPLQQRVRELQRLVGKTLENEILREALNVGAPRQHRQRYVGDTAYRLAANLELLYRKSRRPREEQSTQNRQALFQQPARPAADVVTATRSGIDWH